MSVWVKKYLKPPKCKPDITGENGNDDDYDNKLHNATLFCAYSSVFARATLNALLGNRFFLSIIIYLKTIYCLADNRLSYILIDPFRTSCLCRLACFV